jgi:hypothetical protein
MKKIFKNSPLDNCKCSETGQQKIYIEREMAKQYIQCTKKITSEDSAISQFEVVTLSANFERFQIKKIKTKLARRELQQ